MLNPLLGLSFFNSSFVLPVTINGCAITNDKHGLTLSEEIIGLRRETSYEDLGRVQLDTAYPIIRVIRLPEVLLAY